MASTNGHKHAHAAGVHTHVGGMARAGGDRLAWVLLLTTAYMFAEAAGGWWTGSLSLVADAGHMLTDVAALAFALLAAWFGSGPATSRKTFGFYPVRKFAAFPKSGARSP